jgi:hypothetical protein
MEAQLIVEYEDAGKPEFTSLRKGCSVKNDAKSSVACIRRVP